METKLAVVVCVLCDDEEGDTSLRRVQTSHHIHPMLGLEFLSSRGSQQAVITMR